MIVINNTTKLSYDLTDEEWQAIKDKGQGHKYTVQKETKPKAPADVSSAQYESILKRATKAAKDGKLEAALKDFESAYALKASPYLQTKIGELKAQIEAAAEKESEQTA